MEEPPHEEAQAGVELTDEGGADEAALPTDGPGVQEAAPDDDAASPARADEEGVAVEESDSPHADEGNDGEPQAATDADQAQVDDVASVDADADDAEARATVEATLFASDSPLSPARIAEVAELPGRRDVKRIIQVLNARYERVGSAFRIEPIAGGYQMLTLPEYHDVLGRLLRARSDSKLSGAAMETLAVVAYRQPVLRADIEAIRGVACGEVLRGLMERNLVKIVGRAEIIGRPMLYGTTRRFLEVFGLNALDDLPRVAELRSGAKPAEMTPRQEKQSETVDDADQPAEQTTDTTGDQPTVHTSDTTANQHASLAPTTQEDHKDTEVGGVA